MKISGLKVADAGRDQVIHITGRDVKRGDNKDPSSCAAALACKRELHCTEAQVHIGRTYVKRGRQWLRYVTPSSLKYEIVAFDRGGQFEPGEYVLIAPKGAMKLGYEKPTGPKKKQGRKRESYHVIAGIRSRPAVARTG